MDNEIFLSICSNIYNNISGHEKENRSIILCYGFRPAITMVLVKGQQTDVLSFLSVLPLTAFFFFYLRARVSYK